MKEKHKKVLRICSHAVFGVYVILLVYFLFFAESTGRTSTGRTYQYNLVLFKEIRRFITYRKSLGTAAVILNLEGNIAAFLPFGFLLPVMHQRYRSLLKMMLLTVGFSLVLETIQLISRVGSFDVDDLLLNTIGGILGYLMFAALNRIRRKRDEETSQNK